MAEQTEADDIDYRPALPLIVVTIIVEIVFVALAFIVGRPGHWQVNLLAILAAVCFSIPAGLLLTPMDKEEIAHFRSVGTALLTFLTGYVAHDISAMMRSMGTVSIDGATLFPPVAFASILAVGTSTVYAARRYIDWSSRQKTT